MCGDKLKLLLIGAVIGFVLANLLLLYYGTSTESYINKKTSWKTLFLEGYATHFTFIISTMLLVPVITIVFKVPFPISIFAIILLPIWLDKLIIKKFQLNRKVYSKNK